MGSLDTETMSPGGLTNVGGYRLQDAPLGNRRRFRVVCIGAGYSGLLLSIIISQKMQGRNIDLQVYEMNDDLGGTWLKNRYPGCQCDTPAHIYTYSFCPNPEWPSYYATAPDVHRYLKHTASKYNCERFFKYRHKVTSGDWNAEDGVWNLKVTNLSSGVQFDDRCDVLVNAGGVLSNWKWPDIKGLGRFQGKMMHSASWDESYDLTAKTVAVIGIGSSAVQILPRIAKVASKTTLFARSPTWIIPQGGHSYTTEPIIDADFNYLPEVQRRFAQDTECLLRHRQDLADRRAAGFRASRGGRSPQQRTHDSYRTSMLNCLQADTSEKGRAIADCIIPDFPVGCRRVTPGLGFLDALMLENVETIWGEIDKFTSQGIRTPDGRDLEFDVVICATGFDGSYRPNFKLTGCDGVCLSEQWHKQDPECYFGTTVSGFPNYFMFLGPNSPISNGGLVQGIQAQGVYIAKAIDKMQTQGIKSMEVSEEAMREYNEHTQAYLRTSMWAGSCSSWYKRGAKDGRVVALYAGSVFHFVEMLRRPRWEDYRFEYLGSGKKPNRFAFLGNGFTMREAGNGSIGDTQTVDFDSYWALMELPPIYDAESAAGGSWSSQA